ncbi:MAG: hypothetical protein H0T56_13765 [Pseudaminobacter sp.]|nr:hypothetical protein [Pseudaminobacter sp.]
MNTRASHAVQVLLTERETISASIEKMQAELKDAKSALKSVDEAIAHLTGAPAPNFRQDGPTLKELILEQISEEGGKTPLEIAHAITTAGRETSNTSVSSILSRLRADKLVDKTGDRWTKLSNAKGSDALTSEPFDQDMGPVGRGAPFPGYHPEGSIPSGSTASRDLDLDDILGEVFRTSRDLDDEIPF